MHSVLELRAGCVLWRGAQRCWTALAIGSAGDSLVARVAAVSLRSWSLCSLLLLKLLALELASVVSLVGPLLSAGLPSLGCCARVRFARSVPPGALGVWLLGRLLERGQRPAVSGLPRSLRARPCWLSSLLPPFVRVAAAFAVGWNLAMFSCAMTDGLLRTRAGWLGVAGVLAGCIALGAARVRSCRSTWARREPGVGFSVPAGARAGRAEQRDEASAPLGALCPQVSRSRSPGSNIVVRWAAELPGLLVERDLELSLCALFLPSLQPRSLMGCGALALTWEPLQTAWALESLPAFSAIRLQRHSSLQRAALLGLLELMDLMVPQHLSGDVHRPATSAVEGCAGLRRHVRRRWKAFMRAVHGNTTQSEVAFWNAGGLDLDAVFGVGNGGAGRDHLVSRCTLEWLSAQFGSGSRPTLICLMEVTASSKEVWGEFRRWCERVIKYELRYVPGEGASNRRGARVGSNANGHAALLAVEQAAYAKYEGAEHAVTRVEERVTGIAFRCKGVKETDFVALVHGLHYTGEEGSPEGVSLETRSFEKQIDAAWTWAKQHGGALVCGDFNKVVCARWRPACGFRMNVDPNVGDRKLRAMCGWHCPCCCGPNDCMETQARVVGGSYGDDTQEVGWTRFDGDVPTGRIDFPVEVGESVLGKWRLREQHRPQWNGAWLSDHKMSFVCRTRIAKAFEPRRRLMPLELRRGEKGRAAREAVEAHFDSGEVWEEVWAEVAERRSKREPALEVFVQALRREAEFAAGAADREREAAQEARARGGAGVETARGVHNSWSKRLAKARELRAAGVNAFSCGDKLLFHPRTGLLKLKVRCAGGGSEELWKAIVHRARREVERAGARVAWRLQESKRSFVAKCMALVGSADGAGRGDLVADAGGRCFRAWRIIRGDRGGRSIDQVREHDEEEGEVISAAADPERFVQVLGANGQEFVQELDGGAIPEAFAAWCDVFLERFQELRARNGGRWGLAELSWELFLDVLRRMPRGKAAGAGGLTTELLLAAGPVAQALFYKVMMEDVQGELIPEHWRKVLYVLLPKPGRDSSFIKNLREIALMAVDMKVFMQMMRWETYARMNDRLHMSQMGGCPGYGAVDAGLALELALQQARRLGHSVWVLYIDLKQFYPKINRKVSRIADLVMGLPRFALDIVARVFGKHGDYDSAIKCQYYSAVGMSDEFRNWMGRLMGCVLSPNAAQNLVNTVVVAIDLVAEGYSWYGAMSDAVVDRAWERVLQILYVDDWAAVYGGEELEFGTKELRRSWACWQLWEPISGNEVGVLAFKKTVVTGIRVVAGRECMPADPKLVTGRGVAVKMLPFDQAYPHLGQARRADAKTCSAIAKISSKLDVAVGALRRLRRPTHEELIVCSEGLMTSMGGYYFQTVYFPFEACEKIEARWRAVYNRAMGRDRSSPRAELYQQEPAGPDGKLPLVRTHLWATALASVVVGVNKAVADVDATNQRMGARAALALAFERWGCREDPNRWDYSHLLGVMEDFLRGAPVKYLGDACLFAMGMLESVEFAQGEEYDPVEEGLQKAAAAEASRVKTHGRWQGMEWLPRTDPLHPLASSYEATSTTMIFEPVANGGCGVLPSALLLHAGICAVGHMCKPPLAGLRLAGEWMSAREATVRHSSRLTYSGGFAREWQRVLQELQEKGVEPERPEAVRSKDVPAQRRAAATFGSGRKRVGFDSEAAAAALSAVKRAKSGEAGAAGRQRGWRQVIEEVFPGVQARPAATWNTGGVNVALQARGPRVIVVADAARTAREHGGEAAFLARSEVGADGYVEGWQEAVERALEEVAWDAQGFAVEVGVGERLGEAEIAKLSNVGVRLMAVARLRLGEDVPVHDVWQGSKWPKTSVCLEKMQSLLEELATWCAKVGATHACASDGSWATGTDKAARAAVAHTGQVVAGLMDVEEGCDNYIAELVALIDFAQACPAGARAVLVFDAQSPVLAWLHFRRSHARSKQQFYLDDLLDTLDQELDRLEAVVFLWHGSHEGAPPNEWADVASDVQAFDRNDVDCWKVVRRRRSRHYSIKLTAPSRSVQRWAVARGRRLVSMRLAKSVGRTELRREGDLAIGVLPNDEGLAAKQVLCARRCVGDQAGRFSSLSGELARAMGCPFGCVGPAGEPVLFTWSHLQFFCMPCTEVRAAREKWLKGPFDRNVGPGGSTLGGLRLLAHELSAVRLNGQMCHGMAPHEQAGSVLRLLQGAVASGASDFRAGEEELEVHARRLVGGRIDPSRDLQHSSSVDLRKLAKSVVVDGLAVQLAGERAARAWTSSFWKVVRQLTRVRKYAIVWRARVWSGGPQRASLLADAAGLCKRAAAALEAAAVARAVGKQQRWYAAQRLSLAIRLQIIEARGRGFLALRTSWGAAIPPIVAWKVAAELRAWRLRRVRDSGLVYAVAPLPSDLAEQEKLVGAVSGARGQVVRRELRARIVDRHDTVVALRLRVSAAMRAYVALGGRRALKAAVRAEITARRERSERLQQVAMARYHEPVVLEAMALGEGASGGGGVRISPHPGRSLSGSMLEAVGERYTFQRDLATLRPQRAAARRAAKRRQRQRAAEDPELRQGLRADDASRWAFSEMLEVRWGGKLGTRMEAKVRWEGVDDQGEPWEDSWVGLQDMTSKDRAELRRRLGARPQVSTRGSIAKSSQGERATTGRRRSPRLAAKLALMWEAESESGDEEPPCPSEGSSVGIADERSDDEDMEGGSSEGGADGMEDDGDAAEVVGGDELAGSSSRGGTVLHHNLVAGRLVQINLDMHPFAPDGDLPEMWLDAEVHAVWREHGGVRFKAHLFDHDGDLDVTLASAFGMAVKPWSSAAVVCSLEAEGLEWRTHVDGGEYVVVDGDSRSLREPSRFEVHGGEAAGCSDVDMRSDEDGDGEVEMEEVEQAAESFRGPQEVARMQHEGRRAVQRKRAAGDEGREQRALGEAGELVRSSGRRRKG